MNHSQESQSLKIFVGSSSEAEKHYDHVCGTLQGQGHDVKGWKGEFKKGDGFLASLLRLTEEVDAALLIATADDVLHRRGDNNHVARDNVLFEAGLFIGALGPRCAGIVVVAGSDPVKLPSDLDGINMLTFHKDKEHVFANELRQWIKSILIEQSEHAARRSVSSAMCSIPNHYFSAAEALVFPRLEATLRSASRGVIELTPEQYFDRIHAEMKNAANGTKVTALASSLSTVRWANDPLQNHYIEENFLARERGAEIRRLFLFENASVTPTQARRLLDHLQHGIPVRCRSNNPLSILMDDMVLFESADQGLRAYKAYSDRFYSERVVFAHMLIDGQDCKHLLRRFDEIWGPAREPRAINGAVEVPGLRIPPPARHDFAPGLKMTDKWTTDEVITCLSAANSRGHDLHRELKSLVLWTSHGQYVVHVPGDCEVSLRKVKRILNQDQAYLLPDQKLLERFGLDRGTVCAVLEPVWSMYHLVDEKLLEIDSVVTNNGTHNGYYTFNPEVLLSARSVKIGDFVD